MLAERLDESLILAMCVRAAQHLPWEVRNLLQAENELDLLTFTVIFLAFCDDFEFVFNGITNDTLFNQIADAPPHFDPQMMQVCASMAPWRFPRSFTTALFKGVLGV